MRRTPIIAGNWKLNNTLSESLELVHAIYYGLPWPGEVDVVVAPPLTALHAVAQSLADSYIGVAAQNMFWEASGAYTGEASGPLLKDAGADYVIIGHSERRQYFDETDETVNRKVKAAQNADLIPILCVGETLDERESGVMETVITRQVNEGLQNFYLSDPTRLVVAYEPVWAIGTGKTAKPEQAEAVHVIIRGLLAELFGQDSADQMRILYGGSVKPANSRDLLTLENIDGALVGGASLKAADFIEIIKAC